MKNKTRFFFALALCAPPLACPADDVVTDETVATGCFYRLAGCADKTYDATNGFTLTGYYLQAAAVGNVNPTMSTTHNDANSIYYYDTSNHLIAFATGAALGSQDTESDGVTKLKYTAAAATGSTSPAFTFTFIKSTDSSNKYYIRTIETTCKRKYNNSILNEGYGYLAGQKSTNLDRGALATNTTLTPSTTYSAYYWQVEKVTSLPVTISSAGCATFYTPVQLTIPDGVTAYTGSVNGNTLDLTQLPGTIPAGTGVLLEGAAGTYNFTIDYTTSANDGTADSNDALVGQPLTCIASSTEKYNYTLGSDKTFKHFIGDNLSGFKASLQLDSKVTDPDGSESAIRMVFHNAPTGIGYITTCPASATGDIYDLSGRRVSKAGKGVYIIHGQKVIVR